MSNVLVLDHVGADVTAAVLDDSFFHQSDISATDSDIAVSSAKHNDTGIHANQNGLSCTALWHTQPSFDFANLSVLFGIV